MLISLMQGQLDFTSAVIEILAILMVVFLVLPFHEWAHAFTAMKLGDTSAKYRGRLTLNPLAHIDPMGSLALLLFGFGWAKPVPIDSRNFKRPKLYMAITAVMGPAANILAALFGGLIMNLLTKFIPSLLEDYVTGLYIQYGIMSGSKPFGYYLILFFIYYISINAFLAVFNILPIPPLDGSKILFMFLPDKWIKNIYRYQMIISVVFMVILFSTRLPYPMNIIGNGLFDAMGFLRDGLIKGIMWLVGLPFGQNLSPLLV